MAFKAEVTVTQKVNPDVTPLWNKVHINMDGDKTDLLNLQKQLELIKAEINRDMNKKRLSLGDVFIAVNIIDYKVF
jgi:hypothetical protein